MMLKEFSFWQRFAVFLVLAAAVVVQAEDPYRFFNWNVTYGDIAPLGVRQQVCKLIYYAVSYLLISFLYLGLADHLKETFYLFFYREFLLMANFQGLISILLPMTISSSMSTTTWMNLFFYHGEQLRVP